MTQPAVKHSRKAERLVSGQATSDGAGVKLTRMLTHDLQQRLDPFLMLDAFRTDNPDDYIAGFPDHPHRGFETVTYMIAGCMRHRDNAGHEGLLQSSDVQWMTAGRGIIHSEMPEQKDGVMEGFQLWLNLAARDKMSKPWYRDIRGAEIPEFTAPGGARVRVIAGRSHDIAGAVERPLTEPLYLDIHLGANQSFAQDLPAAHNAFVCTYRGEIRIGETAIGERKMAILDNDRNSDGVILSAGQTPARVLLIAGKPLNEPIVQYGPFVMNTQQQIYEAVNDLQNGRF
jgi:redox-sensitive bicupin YhaK (pirin superfamily)